MLKTRQELFNNAWNGLQAQGWRRAVSPMTGFCRYRASNGDKCALGHSIAAEDYSPDLEALDPGDGEIMDACGIAEADEDFANELRACHDDAEAPYELVENLRLHAMLYGLTIPK